MKQCDQLLILAPNGNIVRVVSLESVDLIRLEEGQTIVPWVVDWPAAAEGTDRCEARTGRTRCTLAKGHDQKPGPEGAHIMDAFPDAPEGADGS